jgi:hypothetical protein
MGEKEEVTEVELIHEEVEWDGGVTQEEIKEDLKTNSIVDEMADSCADNIRIQVESTGSTAENKSLFVADKKINAESMNNCVETVNSIAEKKSILRTNINNDAQDYCGEKICRINAAISVETVAKFVDRTAENTSISNNNTEAIVIDLNGNSRSMMRWGRRRRSQKWN